MYSRREEVPESQKLPEALDSLIKDNPAPLLTGPVALGKLHGGRYSASVFTPEKENTGQISSQAQSLCHQRDGRLALRLLSEDGWETNYRRLEEAVCVRAECCQMQSTRGGRSQEHVSTGL